MKLTPFSVTYRGLQCLRCSHCWVPRLPVGEVRICPKCKSARWDKANFEDEEQDRPPTPREYEAAFLLRADAAKEMAEKEYLGPITQDVIHLARAAAVAWIKTAERLESK